MLITLTPCSVMSSIRPQTDILLLIIDYSTGNDAGLLILIEVIYRVRHQKVIP